MDIVKLEKIVNEYSSDNTEAISFILKSFRPFIIYRCTSTYINGYDFLDLIQECNIALIKAINKYKKGSDSFYKYAKMTINNRLNELIRININKICTTSINDKEIEDTTAFDNINISIDLKRYINTLSEDEKFIIIEHYFNDKTIGEISNNNTKLMRKNYNMLYKALAKLRLKIKKYQE